MSDRRLVFDQLSKRYGSVVALREASFDVWPGELFGFVGSNGAGKTTAMRIALGVLAADSGTVWWDDAPITMETRRNIGYMPEERGLYPKMKVGEQLVYLARLHGLSTMAARRSVAEWTERLGVAARINDEVQKLSLGNQQRVQLAAALVHNRAPGAGRAVLRPRPGGRGRDEQSVAGQGIPGHPGALLQPPAGSRRAALPPGRHHPKWTDGGRRHGRPAASRRRRATRCGRAECRSRLGGRLAWGVVRGWEGNKIVLELESGADDQLVLRTALATGPVREFTRRQASLAELFRNVVSAVQEAA